MTTQTAAQSPATDSPHEARAYWIHSVTPLHVGSGRGSGFIDLPIVREAVTNWPYVPGSSFKGVLTDTNNATPKQRENPANHKMRAAFGVLDENETSKSNNAGSLVFSDARLVCLPVRSIYGTFAWCTSEMSLRRLARDLKHVGQTGVPSPPGQDVDDKRIRLATDSVLKGQEGVFFEDLDFTPIENDADADGWADFIGKAVFWDDNSDDHKAWRDEFKRRFAIVANQIFDFLCETATEVVARVRIDDDRKVVVDGGLWYEESLPAESILTGFVWCDRIFGEHAKTLTAGTLLDEYCKVGTDHAWQLGGKASVGRGRVRCIFRK